MSLLKKLALAGPASLTLAMLTFTTAGCGEQEPECSEELACDVGSVCVQGVCEDIPCSTSAQCGIEEYCLDRQCVAGCAEDSDCYPGSECNVEANTCVDAGCRDTHLDCGYKEFCNTANGECYEASAWYCKSCEAGGDEACGDGNTCLNFGSYGKYCGVECATDDDCPSGFGCLPVGDLSGNITSFQCYTYCWLYEDYDGSLDGAAPPAPGQMPPLSAVPEPVCESGEAL